MNLKEHFKSIKLNEVFEGHSQLNKNETLFLENIIKSEKIYDVMEIGFNAGHSAETFLKNNLNIKLVSFDIGEHEYIKIGKEYIDTNYRGRHTLILGNSVETIPEYIRNNFEKKFDLIFIDGGHDYETAKSDLLNCQKLSHNNTIIIMDDTMKNSNWINSWNIGPNKAWNESIENKIIIEKGFADFSKSHGLSWGQYIFN